jgi:hypothetical protein
LRRKERENEKASQFSVKELEGLKLQLSQDSFRRRVELIKGSRAGFLAFGSSLNLPPSHSVLSEQWLSVG